MRAIAAVVLAGRPFEEWYHSKSTMPSRRIGMSEARRLLPEIAETLARDGGRVDVTYRGLPRISIVRTADLSSTNTGGRVRIKDRAAALRVEFLSPPEDLVETVRALRSRVGRAR